jgi:hypothetical protein
MVVLFSTFFSSLAGGLTIVVFFSTTFSGGAVLTRASHAVKTNAMATGMIKDFMITWTFCFLIRVTAGLERSTGCDR